MVYGYVLLTHAKKVYEREGLSWFWKIHLYPAAIVFLFLDFAFNWTFGQMFLEKPRFELLFSSRVQRNVRTGKGWRLKLAWWWAKQLNYFDEHIKP